jgi:hypothetical protein
MPSSLSLGARKNGHRIAYDAAPDFDISTLGVWCDDNLTPSEMRRVIAMLQDTLDKTEKPAAEDLESPAQRRDRALAGNPNPGIAGDSRGGLPRVTASAAKNFASRYPQARAIRREG